MSAQRPPAQISPRHLPEHQSRQHSHRWLILAIVSTALFLIVVDVTVLYLALPHLTQDLNASASQKLWIVNAYALTVAGLLPGAGALADRYGYKRMFVSGMIVFGLASVIAAFSADPQTLIAARVLLAVGAAMMMPATLAIIRHVFEDPHERGVAIGIWAAIASGAAALGPVVGGLMLEYFWWGSVFLLNVPVIAVALVPALIWIPASRSNPDRPFDLVASLLIMLALVGLTFAIKEASATEPSILRALLALSLSALGARAFVLRQQKTRVVLIDFKLFHNKVFSAGAVTALVASATLMGMELAVSQRFQLIMGMSPLQAGLALLPIPFAAFFAGPISGHYLQRVGVHRMLWTALTISGTGFAGYLFAMNSGLALQIVTFIVMGTGLGAAITAASSAMLLNAPASQAGMAASIEEVSYEFGAALGIATLGSLLSAIYTTSIRLPDHPSLSIAVANSARNSIDVAVHLASTLPQPIADLITSEAHSAFDRGFWVIMVVCTIVLLLTALLVARQRSDSGLRRNIKPVVEQ